MDRENNTDRDNQVKIDSIQIEDKQVKKNIEYENIHKNTNNSGISNNHKLNLDIRSDEYIDKDLQEIGVKFEIPFHLKKTFTCSLILFILGITLIGIGFIEDIAEADPFKGITFWAIGGIVLIPGGYYSYQFYKAKKTRDLQEREDILNEIPEL